MPLHRLKAGYYLLTALASIASSYYFNYLFFFLRDRFGFGNRENLAMAALHGAIYIVASWQAGRFAERRGFHTSLAVGFAGLSVCMAAGALVTTAWLHAVVIVCYTVSVCFLWPAIEALIAQHEPPGRVPHTLGVYNCTWSMASAVAYFTGGSLYGWLGEGALFGVPGAIFLAELFMVIWLARAARSVELPSVGSPPAPAAPGAPSVHAARRSGDLSATGLAREPVFLCRHLHAAGHDARPRGEIRTLAGQSRAVCSVWMFGRLAAFLWLWHWSGWHYRFRFLSTGFALLAVSFVAVLVAPALWMVIVAQLVFGVTCGLMYYSSLFYSMDVGEAKAEHGGLHEAAIGAGICAGPAVGAASLQFFPQYPHASVMAVSALLAVGFAAMLTIWARHAERK